MFHANSQNDMQTLKFWQGTIVHLWNLYNSISNCLHTGSSGVQQHDKNVGNLSLHLRLTQTIRDGEWVSLQVFALWHVYNLVFILQYFWWFSMKNTYLSCHVSTQWWKIPTVIAFLKVSPSQNVRNICL